MDTLWTVKTWLFVMSKVYSGKEGAAANMKRALGLQTHGLVI
jgi:hypothetical protein